MPLCVWALGADGTPVYANRSWLEYAGADAGAQGPLAALHPEDEEAVRGEVQKALAWGEPIELEYRLRSARDGSYRWHAVRFLPQRDPEGVVTGWIGTATDIENFKRAQDAHAELAVKEREAREAAEAANRAKDEFLATLSHELRTPLNAMVGWTHMLRSRTLSPDKEQKALETIERNARAQAELIEDILDVSRIIAGKLRIEIQPVDVQSIVDVAVDAVRPAAEAKAHHLRSPHRRAARSVHGRRGAPAAGDLEPAVERDQVHARGRPRRAGRHVRRKAGRRRGARHRLRHRARVQAVRVRSFPPARQQQPAHARRAGDRPGHRPSHHRASRRHASAARAPGPTAARPSRCALPIRPGDAAPMAVAPEVRQAGAMRPSERRDGRPHRDQGAARRRRARRARAPDRGAAAVRRGGRRGAQRRRGGAPDPARAPGGAAERHRDARRGRLQADQPRAGAAAGGRAAISRRRRSPPTRVPTMRAGRWRPDTSATRRSRSSRRRWRRWSRAWRT